MSESYLGEIRMFGGNYAPQGWALCNGQLLNISENEALYSLLGTTYGGDGVTTFGVPDLQGRVPVHPSSTIPQGAKAGTETVTLTTAQMPAHTHHAMAASIEGTTSDPYNAVWAKAPNLLSYSNGEGLTPVAMSQNAISSAGGSQSHENMMPTLTISFIISLYGAYPPQS